MKTIKDILQNMSEAALRPADNVNVGQVEPVSLSPQDFQAEPPAAVAPFPANVTGQVTDTEGLDEKEFINDPALPATEGNDITSVDDITDRVNGMAEDVASIVDTVMGKLIAESIYEVQLKDELGGIFESQGLNEDFTSKATDIFEAAVTVAGKKHLTAISESANSYIAEQLEVYHQASQAQINTYLTRTVNEWAEENKLALEMGARTKIAESFMEGLKSLLESHYVDLPKDKVDLYESACIKGNEILEQLEAEKAKTASLAEEIASLKKNSLLESALKGLTDVKASKIRTLAESISYTDDASYKNKLDMVVAGLNTTAKKPLTEDTTVQPVQAPAIDNDIANLVSALGQLNRK